jgi:hypothetical protein
VRHSVLTDALDSGDGVVTLGGEGEFALSPLSEGTSAVGGDWGITSDAAFSAALRLLTIRARCFRPAQGIITNKSTVKIKNHKDQAVISLIPLCSAQQFVHKYPLFISPPHIKHSWLFDIDYILFGIEPDK